MEQLTKARSTLTMLTLLHAKSLDQRINDNSGRIDELEKARNSQSIQIDRMLFMIGHLRSIIRRALEENEAVRNAVNSLCFTLKLIFSFRGKMSSSARKCVPAGVVTLLLARLIQNFIGTEIVFSFLSMAFSNKKWRSAFMKTGNATVYATLAYYLYSPVARYMY